MKNKVRRFMPWMVAIFVGMGLIPFLNTSSVSAAGRSCLSSSGSYLPDGYVTRNGLHRCSNGSWLPINRPSTSGTQRQPTQTPPPSNGAPILPVQLPTPVATSTHSNGVTVTYYRWPSANEALMVIPVIAGVALADNLTVVGFADDPIAGVVIAGVGSYVVVKATAEALPYAVDVINGGRQVLETRLGHLKEGAAGRVAQRNDLAASVNGSALNPNQCWKRPGNQPNADSPARALVYTTGRYVVTFLWNLQDGNVTFMEGNVPQDQVDDWDDHPNSWSGTYWEPCASYERNLTIEKILQALEYMGF